MEELQAGLETDCLTAGITSVTQRDVYYRKPQIIPMTEDLADSNKTDPYSFGLFTLRVTERRVSLEISYTVTVSLVITDQVQELNVLDVPLLLTRVL